MRGRPTSDDYIYGPQVSGLLRTPARLRNKVRCDRAMRLGRADRIDAISGHLQQGLVTLVWGFPQGKIQLRERKCMAGLHLREDWVILAGLNKIGRPSRALFMVTWSFIIDRKVLNQWPHAFSPIVIRMKMGKIYIGVSTVWLMKIHYQEPWKMISNKTYWKISNVLL